MSQQRKCAKNHQADYARFGDYIDDDGIREESSVKRCQPRKPGNRRSRRSAELSKPTYLKGSQTGMHRQRLQERCEL